MNIEQIISRFEKPQRSGRGWKVCCPCHDDKKNSLSIAETDNGKILLKCQAGCSTKTVIDAVKLTWRDLASPSENSRAKDDPVIARYVYVDENAKPLFRVCRTRAKEFFQERYDSSRWVPGLKETRRVVYRLPEVLKSEKVFVVEGEKDADRLAALGIVATTNAGGARKWHETYNDSLKNKHVVVIPDNDDPGREHAIAVARSVLPVARSVKVVTLPDVPEKGDVSDYLKTHTKEDLLALVEAAPVFDSNANAKKQTAFWPELISAKDLLSLPPDPLGVERLPPFRWRLCARCQAQDREVHTRRQSFDRHPHAAFPSWAARRSNAPSHTYLSTPGCRRSRRPLPGSRSEKRTPFSSTQARHLRTRSRGLWNVSERKAFGSWW